MSKSPETETITVEVPSDLSNQLSEEAEQRGFTDRAEFIQYLLRNGAGETSLLSEEHAEELRQSRRQLNEDEGLPSDEVFEALRETDSDEEFAERLGITIGDDIVES